MKHEITVDLKWFNFSQNNSGGRFTVNENLAEEVFIQARSAEEALQKAHSLLDESNENSCPCCGDRWSFYIDESDGFDFPTIYGEPITQVKTSTFRRECRLHYFDGRIESFKFQPEAA